jgi:hypothetical protein
MAFTDAITGRDVWGSKAIVYGTYVSDGGSTGGDIDTGLHRCEFIKLTPKGSSVVASHPVVDETLPVAGSAVTIKTTANESGYWYALGDALA